MSLTQRAIHPDLAELLPDDMEIPYEEELLRNPYSVNMWIRYINARKDAPSKKRYLLYERAVKALPGSYKVCLERKFSRVSSPLHHLTAFHVFPVQLWRSYLLERRSDIRHLPINHPSYVSLNNTYERALVSMHKMPRIWTEYLEFLTEQKVVTLTRRAFDRALMSLPITQHDRIWALYITFISQAGIPIETALRVYRRYLMLEPMHAEEYIAYLVVNNRWGEAASRLADIVSDETFRSLEGKSKHQLWLELCEIITKHPAEVAAEKNIQVDAILRTGISRYSEEVGRLWTSLADYHIRRGAFEKARDVYEEGLTSVITVRDFSLIFDALMQFEEALIRAKMEGLAEEEEEEEEIQDQDATTFLLKDNGNDLDLRLERLERLIERRPEMVSSVVLRQNPHNVGEWHKRVKIFAKDPARQIMCYSEALKTVDAELAIGKPHGLWVAFAKFYESHGELNEARVVFDRAVNTAKLKYVDDLASIWCEWAEMELRHKNYKKALELLREATSRPARPRSREEESGMPLQARVYRSLKLWSMRCDLEESLGTLESTKEAYEAAMAIKVATSQMILNYAAYLQEEKYFEEAFKVYEKGIHLFKYPHVKDIWTAYLAHFVTRYKGTKVERGRDLFREAISAAPAEFAKPFYLQFANFEESYGTKSNLVSIFEDAVKKVPAEERLSVYEVYLAKAWDYFGVPKVREVYEMAFNAEPPFHLPDADARTMCIRFAALETKLGEIPRARGIFTQSSSLADPRSPQCAAFWEAWNDFEVQHGNEETFREMLRIKRSVAAALSDTHFNTAIIDAAALGTATLTAVKRRREEEAGGGEQGLAQPLGTRVPGFVSAGVMQQGKTDEAEKDVAQQLVNPEDIDLGEFEEEEEAVVEAKEVPSSVYGELADRSKKQKTAE